MVTAPRVTVTVTALRQRRKSPKLATVVMATAVTATAVTRMVVAAAPVRS